MANLSQAYRWVNTVEVSYYKLWKVMMHISKRSTVELSKLQKEGVLIYDKNRFE